MNFVHLATTRSTLVHDVNLTVDHTNTPTTVNEFLPFQSTGLRSQEPLQGYDQKCKYCAERRQLANSQQLTGGDAGWATARLCLEYCLPF